MEPLVTRDTADSAVSGRRNNRAHLVDGVRRATRGRHLSPDLEWLKDVVKDLLGHSDVATTMIYTHVLNRGGRGARSPLDDRGGDSRQDRLERSPADEEVP